MLCDFGELYPSNLSRPTAYHDKSLLTNASQTLANVVSMDVIAKSILPMLDKMVDDDIPNIRFNVAKTYTVLANTLRRLPEEGTLYSLEKEGKEFEPSPRGQELIDQKITPNLSKLQKDDDVDVRFFATTGLGEPAGVATVGGAGQGQQAEGEPMNTSP